jgi:NAD+ synthase
MVYPELKLNARATLPILVSFIRLEMRKAGKKRAVLGLSGGIDSALVAGLAVRALGARQVLGLLMPYKTSSSRSLSDALKVARRFRLRTMKLPVTAQVDAYFRSCRGASALRRGNKMARERMSILYDQSAAWDALVLGTSNKTEICLGYGTIHGDVACALNPVGDLYKTQVRQLARVLGVPREVLEKSPSADLWKGQTDEGELGFSYDEVDRLLYWMVDRRLDREHLKKIGFEGSFIRRVQGMMDASAYKRRLPPIANLSSGRR